MAITSGLVTGGSLYPGWKISQNSLSQTAEGVASIVIPSGGFSLKKKFEIIEKLSGGFNKHRILNSAVEGFIEEIGRENAAVSPGGIYCL